MSADRNRILQMIESTKFEKRWRELTQEASTYEEAYELAEREFMSVFGKRRYANYESFRTVRSRRVRRQTG